MSPYPARRRANGFIHPALAIVFIQLLSGGASAQITTTTKPTTSATKTSTSATTKTSKLPSECAYLECLGECCSYGQVCRHTNEWGFVCIFPMYLTTVTLPGTTFVTNVADPETTKLYIDTNVAPVSPTQPPSSTSTSYTGTTLTSRPILTGSTTTQSTTSTTTSTPTGSPTPTGDPAGSKTKSSSSKTGNYVGIALGALFGSAALVGLILWFRSYRRRHRRDALLQQQANMPPPMYETPAYPYNPHAEAGGAAIMEMGQEYQVYEADGTMIAVPNNQESGRPVFYWDGREWVRDEQDGRNWGSNWMPMAVGGAPNQGGK
ncbi:hypothetical protein DFH27DRAFT_199808 [Peziza echinospora]|nr:hypothetical protein DFH27DRAFT_199808 [Peziza echinospora]